MLQLLRGKSRLLMSTEIRSKKPSAVWHRGCKRGDITHWCLVPARGLVSFSCRRCFFVYLPVPSATECARRLAFYHIPSRHSQLVWGPLCSLSGMLWFPKCWSMFWTLIKLRSHFCSKVQNKRDFPGAFNAQQQPAVTRDFFFFLLKGWLGPNLLISYCHRTSFDEATCLQLRLSLKSGTLSEYWI